MNLVIQKLASGYVIKTLEINNIILLAANKFTDNNCE